MMKRTIEVYDITRMITEMTDADTGDGFGRMVVF